MVVTGARRRFCRVCARPPAVLLVLLLAALLCAAVGAVPARASAATGAQTVRATAAPVTTWRVLLLIFRETDTDYVDSDGTTRHLRATLPQSDIDDLLASLRGAVQPAVREWSGGQAAWDVEVQYPSEPISRVTQTSPRSNWVDPGCIPAAMARYFRPDHHDFVMVYWRASDGAGAGIPSDGWGWASLRHGPTYGYVTVTYPGPGRWNATTADISSQVWIHEWLHPVSYFYRDQGHRLPTGDADGAESHGYVSDQPPYPGWGTYYADLMNDRVSEDGVNTGIPAEAWASGTIRGADYTITPSVAGSSEGHGRISPATPQVVTRGATPSFDFRPDPGYEVAEVRLDGVPTPLTGENQYTFAPVTAAHAISVSFRQATPEPPPPTLNVLIPSPVSAVRGDKATLRFTVQSDADVRGPAAVTITIKTLAGKVASRKAAGKVPLNTAQSFVFLCTLNRGRYRFYVSALAADGTRSSGNDWGLLTVK